MNFSKLGAREAKFRNVKVAFLAAMLAVLIVILTAACAKGKAGIGAAKTDAASGGWQDTVLLDGALAEIRDFTPGEGVPAGVFEKLREELARLLEERAENRDGAKVVSRAPDGAAGLVTDLSYDSATRTLNWTYMNAGDYDQNGTVEIADVTQIALNFGKTRANAGDSFPSWVDGDGDGEIGISDITPIALNYGSSVASYSIYTSEDADSGFVEIGNIPIESANPGSPMRFEAPLLMGAKRYFKVEPRDAEGAPGATSAWINTEWHIVGIEYFDEGHPYYWDGAVSGCAIDGKPSIAYISPDNGFLRFIQAKDSSGASWSQPHAFDNWAVLPFLIEVQGNPAIFFFDYDGNYPNVRFKYMRALNPEGTQWHDPIVLSGGIDIKPDYNTSNWRSVVFDPDNKLTAVFIADGSIYVVNALDFEGTVWSEPEELPHMAASDVSIGYVMGRLNLVYIPQYLANPAPYPNAVITELWDGEWRIKAELPTFQNYLVTGLYFDTDRLKPSLLLGGLNSALLIANTLDIYGNSWGPLVPLSGVSGMNPTTFAKYAGRYYIPLNERGYLGLFISADLNGHGWFNPTIVDKSKSHFTSISFIKDQKGISMAYFTSANDPRGVILRYAYELNANPLTNQPPNVELRATPQSGESPLYVEFTASSFYDPDGMISKYEIDYDGDGTIDKIVDNYGEYSVSSSFGKMLFDEPGQYDCTVTVYDEHGASATSTIRVTVKDEWGLSSVYEESSPTYVLGAHDAEGVPAVAWSKNNYSEKLTDIFYVFAQDSFGSTWNSPVYAAQFALYDVFEHQFKKIGGFPSGCASMYSASDQVYSLKYFSAIDSLGSEWSEAVTLTTPDERPELHQMLDAGGLPLIIYYEKNSKQFRAMKGNDRFGNGWVGPILIETLTSDPIAGPKAAIIAGKPSLIYSARVDNNYSFRYIGAMNEEGTAWGNSVVVERKTINVFALSDIGGVPVIAYFDNPSGGGSTLLFRIATNQDGSEWSEPIELDPERQIKYAAKGTIEILFVGGKPDIAYNYDSEAWLCRSLDSGGQMWGPVERIVNYSSGQGAFMKRPDEKLGYAYMETKNIMFTWER